MIFREVNPDNDNELRFLYEILEQREPDENISHKTMPTYQEHCKFVVSKPYRAWYIVLIHNNPVGSCYVSDTDEVGVAVLKKHRKHGIATKILQHLIKTYPNASFLANINPKNEKSIKLFEKVGFKHIQNTYRLS